MKTPEEIEAAVDFLNGSEGSEESVPVDLPNVSAPCYHTAIRLLAWVLDYDD